jgi:hypothetical protein
VAGAAGGHADLRPHRLLRSGDIRAIGARPPRNFRGPIQTIIPWASNLYTETLIDRVRAEFGAGLLGLLDVGRHGGGGMGFIFDPRARRRGRLGWRR